MTPHWTKDKPTEDGFYWYRWTDGYGDKHKQVIKWYYDARESEPTLYKWGSDQPHYPSDLTGEFWSERLIKPE